MSLADFMREFSLTTKLAARLFGVSERTVRRWRRQRTIPRRARVLVESCRAGVAPINYSLHRGPKVGVEIYDLRPVLFGPNWRSWRPQRRRMRT